MTTVLVLLGLALEALLVAWVLATARNERLRLAALLEAAPDAQGLKRVLEALPEAEQQIATEMVNASQGKTSVDEVLVQAMVVATGEPFAPRLGTRVLMVLGLVSVAFAPVVHGAWVAANGISETAELTRRVHKAAAYLEWQTRLEAPFSALREAYRGTGLLLVGLAFLTALSWWLRRPEVREARFVRTLLLLATRLKPTQPLSASARLAELIAPNRSLSRPIAASLIWVAATTVGWLLLQQTAEVRAANAHQPTFDVWPSEQRHPITSGTDLTLPKEPGGAPLDDRSRPTMEIGRDSVRLQQRPLADLEQGALPDPWEGNLAEQAPLLNQFPRPLEVNLLIDQGARWSVVRTVLARVAADLEVRRFLLIVERRVRFGSRTEVMQAALPLELGHSQKAPALRIEIGPKLLRVGNNTSIPLDPANWQFSLRERLRQEPGLLEEDRGPIEIEVDPAVSYRSLISILATADSACLGETDCGLPGQGFRFVLRP